MGRNQRTARALASLRPRGIALFGLAMIVAGCVWAALAMAASDQVEIKKPSGNEELVTISDQHSDWKTYRYDGVNKEGRSLASVLKEIGVGDRAWTTIEVDGLRVDNGSFKRSKPPIFFIKGRSDEVSFYRPKTSFGDADTRSASGGNLDMSYRAPLEIKASDNSPKAGQTVTYEALVKADGPQSVYEFAWTASSGENGEGRTFEYTYPKSSGEVSITVTAKRASDNMTVGTSTAATHDIEYTPPPASNGGGSGYGSGYSYTPPSDYNYDSDFPDAGDPSSDNPDSEVPKTQGPEGTPSLDELGTDVEGELLSAVAPLPPSSGDAGPVPPEEEAPDPEQAMEEAEEISAPGALIAGGIVVGLLGLGAGREMENVRPRLIRRPNLSGLRRLSPPWK